MALASVVRPISGGAPAEPPRGGAIWLKWIRKSDGEPASDVCLAKEEGEYSIKRVGGNATMVKATVAVIPGPRGTEPVVTAYAVPGDFTPTVTQPYPPGSPVAMVFGGVRGDLASLDHVEFYLDIPVAFTGNKAQLVFLLDTGAYCVVPYDEESLPQLTTVTITSAYPGGRTGFTSGDVINLSFAASAPVSEVLVWPHDAVLGVDGVPTGTPQVIAVAPAAASGTFSATVSAISGTAFNASGRLYVAARQYGHISTPIQTSATKVFDERSPTFDGSPAVTYPAGQTAIKGTEQATVQLSGMTAAGTVTANFGATNRLAAVGTPPFTVTGGTCSFAVQRGASGFDGFAELQLTATNTNNGKTSVSSASFVQVAVQTATGGQDIAAVVNGGAPIQTRVGGRTVTISLSSAAVLANPGASALFPGITVNTGAWATSDGGRTWTTTGTVADTAARGTFQVDVSGMVTGAGTSVGTTIPGYKISGFEQRQFIVSPAFSADINLGTLPVDYAAGLQVLDLAYNPTTFTYNGGLNRITLTDQALIDLNSSGTMPVYISQAPSP